jgi:hypothetical protein
MYIEIVIIYKTICSNAIKLLKTACEPYDIGASPAE